MTTTITSSDLAQFYGSEKMYFHPMFRGINYTDGVRYLNHNGAGWLVDAILSHALFTPKVKREEFVAVILKVTVKDGRRSAWLRFEDGNNKALAKQYIEYTDFPLDEITLFITNGVLMLASEY